MNKIAFRQSWRLLSLGVLTAVCIINSLAAIKRTPPPSLGLTATPLDPAIEMEKRLAQLRIDLARIHPGERIGYIADPASHDAVKILQDYSLAELTLLPVILDRNFAPYSWAIANLREGKLEESFLADWSIYTRYDSGVLLLKRNRP